MPGMHDQFELSRRNLLRGTAWLGGAAALSGLPLGRVLAQAQTAGIETHWPTVTAMIEKYVRRRKVSGMVAALGWKDQAPGYIRRGKEGFDDRDPSGPDSLFRAYSMTKPLTGMAAMILIDEGKLKLDQPLADFVPEFANMQVAIDPKVSLDARPAKNPITIRHLLTHTSGLGYAVVGRNKVADRLYALGLNPGIITKRKVKGVNDGPPTPGPDEFLRLSATVPLVAEPGTKWAYSMSLDVLGLVVGRAAGTSFDQFVKDRILGPCGMTSSCFQVPMTVSERLTTNYGYFLGSPVAIDKPGKSIYQDPIPFAFGGSGLVTSPADFDRFLTMLVNYGLLDGKRVMSEAAVRLGTSNLLPEGADLTGTWVAGQHFGAGGIVGTGKDEGLFGWSGAAGTIGFAQMKMALRTSLYVQYMPQNRLPILSEFPKAVGADLTAMQAKKA
ncbi:MAG: beta-lactamase family protein [Sphingomonadales bacterium]|nr:beta-lactamase family protein [Sphingomonadaceae bacterium]MBS3930326.1 beta-lactamase family protein [Sphingomonadales bacterium]